MKVRVAAVSAAVFAVLMGAVSAMAQSPSQQPLVQAGNLSYLGKFSVPQTDGTGRPLAEGGLTWGGAALGLGADGQSLYFGCHAWGNRLSRVTIPAIGGMASVVEPCAPIANLAGINPGDGGAKLLGGSLAWNGRLTVSAYAYYDANGTAVASHFVGTTVANQTGPYRIGSQNPGLIGGYMGVIPLEWRSLLGGPALTGECCLAIIGRTSAGPSASVFNPDDVGVANPAPSTMLVGYPAGHQTLGTWNTYNPYFSGATSIVGVAFPAGTRTVMFVGRHGSTFCYGSGTSNQALAGTPDGQGNIYCYDPTDSSKGTHGYPYHHQVWAYDANDLLAVKQGAKQPWDVRPYGVWTLTDITNNGGATIRSATYDPTTRRLFVTVETGGGQPAVHIYEVTNAVLRPPTSGPLGFSAQVTAAGTALVWFPPTVQGLTGYRLDVGSSPGASDVSRLSLPATASNLPLPSGVTGTFYVRLVALFSDGTSGASPELHLVLGGGGAGLPTAPTNFRAAMSGGSLVLTWDPPADASVSTVVVDAGTASGATNVTVATPLGKFGPYVVPNPPPGTFFLRLRAVSASGSSSPSNEAMVSIGSGGGGATSPPAAPVDFGATVGPGRTVTLQWLVNTSGPAPTGFVLEGGSRSGLSDLASVNLQSLGLTTGPVPAGVYYVRVRAANGAGISAPSREIRLVVP